MRVLAYVADVPVPVVLGDFADEAAAIHAVNQAQAHGLVVRDEVGITIVPAARVLRYLVRGAEPVLVAAAPVAATKARPAKPRAR